MINLKPIDNPNRWFIVFAVMLVAVIEVLDMTIVNVALPNMMGALGANSDQITWVLTSYIVSSAICMPLTGFLVNRVGRRKLLIIDIIGFLGASMICGMATNLETMVFFRILQGLFGATLVPLSQYVLRDTFTLEEQGKAMAIWGIGIMAGPVLGPTIGGYITEHLDWRWIFYMNIPVCVVALFMCLKVIHETPREKQHVDFLGLGLMAVGIGCLQVFLDRGNEENWLDSNFIQALMLISFVSLLIFIIRGLRTEKNIINLRLFKDKNFTISTIMLTVYAIAIFGLMAVQPIMLENFMNYPADTAGLAMAPRGLACAIAMGCVAGLMKWFDSRLIIGAGIIFSAYGSYMLSHYNLQTSEGLIMWSGAVQGFGMGLFFVPISAISLSTLPKKDMAEGSGLFSFGRSLGSSVGISIMSTVLSRESQINWNRLGGHLYPGSPELTQWLNTHNLTMDNPLAAQLLGQELMQQASIVAFLDSYYLTAVLFVMMIPLIFLLNKPDLSGGINIGH